MKRTWIADGSGSMPALEQVCSRCEGSGDIPNRREGNRIEYGGSCNDCYGAGTILTDDGKRLLEFLRSHARLA